MKVNRIYTLYKHTSPNGKVYIGITSQKPSCRWQNGKGYRHNDYFFKAIQKYGWENFKHEILYTNLSQEEAEQKEIELIAKYNSTNPQFGFNVLKGGDARSGLCGELNPMYGVRLFGELNPNFGNHLSEESKKKISEAKKGSTLTEEHKKILSKRFSGELNPMYGVHRYGELNPFYGKTHSQESRVKMSDARKGRFKGSENPHARKIVCITTNEIFDSLAEAVNKYGISQGNLSMACMNPQRSCGKLENGTRLKWMYYDEYIIQEAI